MFFSLLEMLLLAGLAGTTGWFLGGNLGAFLGALLALVIHGAMLQWKLEYAGFAPRSTLAGCLARDR